MGSRLVTLQIDAVTIFPEMFAALTDCGVTRRALEDGIWSIGFENPRDHVTSNYRTVDDRPYGGGPGMVMMAAPLEQAIVAAKAAAKVGAGGTAKVIYLSPQGARIDQKRVAQLAASEGAILLCGRYEGIDERVIARCVDEELSLGDFVLSGGELVAMALMDACIRQLPGALNDEASAVEESFVAGLLDCPHYTRPELYEGMKVPDVLLSGNHEAIRRWRLKQALGRTWQRRPDLIAARVLSSEEAKLLAEFQREAI